MGLSISNFVENVTSEVRGGFDLFKDGVEDVVTTTGDAAQATFNGAADLTETLTETYDTRVGSDLLPPGVAALRNARTAITEGVELTLAVAGRAGEHPDKVYDGVYVGADGRTFPPSTPLSRIPPVKQRDNRTSTETIIYVNGIDTSKDGQAASLQGVADRTGAQVVGVHNATEGMVTDLRQCVADKLDKGSNPAVDTLADAVYDDIHAGRPVHVVAHSQGGLVTSRALKHVYQRLRIEDGLSKAETERKLGLVKVETFGGAAGRYPDGPQYVHYINRDDIVPSLFGLGWDVDKYNPTLDAGRGAVVHWFTDIHLNPLDSHSFEETYLPRRVPFDQARRGDFSR